MSEKKRVIARPTVEKAERWERERKERFPDKPTTKFIETCVDSALKEWDAVDDLLSEGADAAEVERVRRENERLRTELRSAQEQAETSARYLVASGQTAVVEAVEAPPGSDEREGLTLREIGDVLVETARGRTPRLVEAMIDDGLLVERDGRYYRGETQL